jgi:DNA helicase-2/ATP-dependent DNA helicase PcrA
VVDLAELNPPQREAAGHGDGPMLVLAGAGSGKTRVITYRIAELLQRGVPGSAICAVTFTNKAAEEMRERVAALVRDRAVARQLTIGTFHALGLHILKTERRALGMPRGFVIYDQADQLGVVREAMRNLHDGDRRYDVKAILARISLAKNRFIEPEAYVGNPADDYDAATVEVYPRYQEQLRACAAFDFDDLIVEPVRLWTRSASTHRTWAERFQHVLVDEFQDTNPAQLRMVQLLVADHNNLVVVGDDDQSIYSWRGADPANILRFADVFHGAKVVKLEQNYRSTRHVLDAANAVIANNPHRHGKTLWSQLGTGEPITHAVAPTAEDEAKWVTQEIRRLHDSDGRRWSDVAVLYRSNIQAKVLEEELRVLEVPYVMYGGQQFFERKEVKDLIAYLRVALNPRDELALRRVLNYPARGIGATTVERLAAAAHERGASLWDALRGVAATLPGLDAVGIADVDGDELDDDEPRHPRADVSIDLRGAARNGVLQFVDVVSRTRAALTGGGNIVAVTKSLIADIALYDDLRAASSSQSAAQRRIDNVEGLLGSLERFAAKNQGSLAEYLRHLSLESREDEDRGGDRVVLTTLHGAKGLEFPVCFLIGMEEELLPHARTLQPQASDVVDPDHATDISEERRLCYVGITRAQRKLYLTRACTRVSRGRTVPRTPSRFLLEIPDELLEVRDLGEEARQRVPAADVASFFASLAAKD